MVATTAKPNLALLGNRSPAFASPLPVGQLNFPSWEKYEQSFRSLFERQYYTNQGPLTEELESKLAERLSVRHAICVTNATLGLTMTAEALDISGKVLLPAFTFVASAQSLLCAGLSPLFSDIDPGTHHLDPEQLEQMLDREQIGAVMAVNLWGGSCDPGRLSDICQRRNVPIYFDSAHAFGCIVADRPIGSFGQAEVFSFHATKVLSAGEGGCISTNDDILAERLRNIRSSYGVRQPVGVCRTANGRMSEAQAALALLSLEDFDAIVARNRALHECYRDHLADLPGIRILEPHGVAASNYQYLVSEIDPLLFGLSRDTLHQALRAENIMARRYFSPGIHRCPPFNTDSSMAQMPATDALCQRILQLPLGARVDLQAVERICELLHEFHRHAPCIAAYSGGNE
jgi:dTDP-4-amino-4,6-dideoxygalactose transaminase